MSQTIVIFGATGDLSREKLFPALFNLFKEGSLEDTNIVAFGRREWVDKDFHEYVYPYIEKRGNKKEINSFLKFVSYEKGTFDDLSGYQELSKKISDIALFYLAVSPEHYETIISKIKESNLKKVFKNQKSKILIEKPFGLDLEKAKILEKKLRDMCDEDQIYRIDHYLAKSQVLNMLELKLNNSDFVEFFNNKNIKEISIRLFEKKDIGTRGISYDNVGALVDVGQNHLLQVLATTLMVPDVFEPDTVRSSRMKVLFNLQVVDIIKGQYQGYLAHTGVKKNSKTETYFKIKLKSKDEDLKGIDINIESGKAMEKDLVEIECLDHENKSFKIEIQPEHSVVGFDKEITKALSKKRKEAYEQLFFDALRTNNELFPSFEEIVQAWEIVRKAEEKFKGELMIYKKNKYFIP